MHGSFFFWIYLHFGFMRVCCTLAQLLDVLMLSFLVFLPYLIDRSPGADCAVL